MIDTDKLNLLAGRAMGWELQLEDFGPRDCRWWKWVDKEGHATLRHDRIEQSSWGERFEPISKPWRPAKSADDALELLEKVLGPQGMYQINFNIHNPVDGRFFCLMNQSGLPCGQASKMPLAMTLCALRAAGVSDADMGECK